MSDADLREHERKLAQQGIKLHCIDLTTHVSIERKVATALVRRWEWPGTKCSRTPVPPDSPEAWTEDACAMELDQLIRDADEAAGLEVGE